MTRVCVTWDREETARLVTRCRDALAVSDETASAADDDTSVWVDHADRISADTPAAGWYVLRNRPSTRLALNRALTAVLDGIAATLGRDYESHGRDMENALTSLAAIAEALGVEVEGRWAVS